MFTGIVTDIGTVTASEQRGDLRVRIACSYDPATIAIGASIACSGACMTVVEKGGEAGDAWFAVDVSAESVSRTVPAMWSEGARLNLETALKLGDELGGHIVTGHVDGVAQVTDVVPDGDSRRIGFRVPADLAPFLAPKGSVTVDGVSLTVAELAEDAFAVALVPHTLAATTLSDVRPGQPVNLEADVLAKYVERLISR